MLLGVSDMINDPNLSSLLMPYGLGLVVAFIFTLLSYKYLTSLVKKGKLLYFSIYCLLLGIGILIFL